jgi:hypothetical protein
MFSLHVCLTAAPGWDSRLIRKITRSDVSHALLLYRSVDHGCWWVEEAMQPYPVRSLPAVRRAGLTRDLRRCYALELAADQERDVLHRWAMECSALPYDWRLNVELAFVEIGNRLAGRERWGPRWVTAGRNCSEAAAAALAPLGCPCGLAPTPGQLDAALARWSLARPAPVEEVVAMLEVEARGLSRVLDSPCSPQGPVHAGQ